MFPLPASLVHHWGFLEIVHCRDWVYKVGRYFSFYSGFYSVFFSQPETVNHILLLLCLKVYERFPWLLEGNPNFDPIQLLTKCPSTSLPIGRLPDLGSDLEAESDQLTVNMRVLIGSVLPIFQLLWSYCKEVRPQIQRCFHS